MLDCRDRAASSQPVDLYNLAAGQWRIVTLSQQLGCGATDSPYASFATYCLVVAVGRYWLKVDVFPCSVHCPDSYFLQNIYTGQVKRDPARQGGRTFDELNVPSGQTPLCSPLRYPTAEGANYEPEPGSMAFYGQFAVANGDRLRRCHSHLSLLINHPPIFGTTDTLIWSEQQSPAGIFLPGLQRFTVPLPKTVDGTICALTQRTIYVQGHHGVWAASWPYTQPH
jgi:hypothetical protein